jgi:hypothetical protein
VLENVTVTARNLAAVSLGSLSALHVLWSTGSSWPARDRETLAEAIGGFSRVPGTGACLMVATLLGTAATCVVGIPGYPARITRLGSAIASFVLFARGSVGLAGRMPHAKRSRTFAELDRRVYSPVCLVIATLTLAGALRDNRR